MIADSPLEKKLEALVAPTLDGMGYALVRIKMSGGRTSPTVQIMAERQPDVSGNIFDINLDDCTEISHTLSALLDVEDPIEGEYRLEISSPGIDRPLTRPSDFARFAGHDINLETRMPIEGRRRFRGILEGISQGIVRLDVEGMVYQIPADSIQSAKIVMTDALIAAELKKRKLQPETTENE